MTKTEKIDIIEHALDNGINAHDYMVYKLLEDSTPFTKIAPDPCHILPRQFGYWFHTGPGFAPETRSSYSHRLIRADSVRVLGGDGVVVFQGGWVESLSLGYARTHLDGCQFVREGSQLMIRKPVRRLTGKWFLGFNAGHNNYAHWVTDQLPMVYYYKMHLAPNGIRLLLPKHAGSFVNAYIDLLDIPAELIDYVDDEVLEVETLIYGSFFPFDAIPMSATNLIKEFKNDCLPVVVAPKSRIFVSRSETVSRALLNEGAIFRMLHDLGFKLVIPGQLSVAEQIDAFRSAECVVGAHGAALANIVFCEPGTRVIELFPEYTVSSLFWMLASHFDLKYGTIFGTSFDQDIALTDQAGSWDAPFVIDEVALRQSLSL